MKTLRGPFVLMVLTVAAASQAQTFLGELNGRLWYYIEQQTTFDEARTIATGMGGTLASVRDQGENDWLLAQGVTQRAWIGLSDIAVEGTFVWDDSAPFSYSNWETGEPDDDAGTGGNGDAVAFNYSSANGKWGDTNPTFTGFVEGSLVTTPVPEPASMVALGLGVVAVIRRRKARA